MKDDIIHIYMFEDGNLLLSGYPTTATEKSKFQLHLYTESTNQDQYRLEIAGNYEPTLNIENASKFVGTRTAGVLASAIDFAEVGPFTSSATFTLKRVSATPEVINTSVVKIAKTIHASIGTGLIVSWLKDPTNIRRFKLPTGDSTLLADNPNGNASLTLMATLYPWGRNNLMLEGPNYKHHLGVVIGTNIASSSKNFRNFMFGLQYDFSLGGSFVAGIEVANRQKIQDVDYSKFVFGESKFTGNVADKLYKQVGVGMFFGVQVDSRIFAKMFATTP